MKQKPHKLSTPTRAFQAALAAILVLSGFFVGPQQRAALAEELPPFFSGIAEGTGTNFEITDSEYLNIALESSEPVSLYMESAPQAVTFSIESASSATSTHLTLSGLEPLTTYYKYENNYHHLTEFTADEHGRYSYTQNISEPAFIIIQTHKSTLFISDDATGGDCIAIGIWDQAIKTCTLTQNVHETIQIDSDGITLDGNGYGWTDIPFLTTGVYMSLKRDITVKNFIFPEIILSGVHVVFSDYVTIINNTFFNEGIAINVTRGNHNTFTYNKIDREGRKIGRGMGVNLGLNSTDNTVQYNTISRTDIGIRLHSGTRNNLATHNSVSNTRTFGLRLHQAFDNEIYNNNIINNPAQISVTESANNKFNLDTPVGGNYWSNYHTPEQGCHDMNNNNFCDAPFAFPGGQDNLPQTRPLEIPSLAPEGYSNVAFIPGLQASRLYTPGSMFENRLWEPNRTADVEKLFLTETGESMHPNIYTRDIIDEAFGYNIYKNFMSFMDELVEEEIIKEWRALPYDWRFDFDSHIPAMITEIERLAATSDNGKVTIIAHSNGGLVTKALLMRLEEMKTANESNLIDSVDRIILVAAPQLGTPKAVASLLHGYDLDLAKGLLLDKATARSFGERMPSAFNLLPSRAYFDRVLDPVIQFDESANRFMPFTLFYGPYIDTLAELHHFLTGANGSWTKPDANDITSPNVLGSSFLEQATQNHTNFETWNTPDHIDVIQIAGWGLDTVRTIEYTAKRTFTCGNISFLFCNGGYKLDYRPIFTSDGDETVVTPSAVAMEGKRFYVNLLNYNEETLLRQSRKHADIFEVKSLRDFLKNLLIGDDRLPTHIVDSSPTPDIDNKRLRISVHSPVSISIYDEFGNHTGLIPHPDPESGLTLKQEDIANSYYMEFGEGKYVGFGTNDSHTITLQGTATGTFTLKIEEVLADEITSTLTYENIPVTASTVAELTLQTIEDASELRIDLDGNGTFDFALSPDEPVSAATLLEMLAFIVETLDMNRGAKENILALVRSAAHAIEKSNMASARALLQNIERITYRELDKTISQEDAYGLIGIVESIRLSLDL